MHQNHMRGLLKQTPDFLINGSRVGPMIFISSKYSDDLDTADQGHTVTPTGAAGSEADKEGPKQCYLKPNMHQLMIWG